MLVAIAIAFVCTPASVRPVGCSARAAARHDACRPRMSELSDLAAEQKRLGRVLAQVQTDIGSLRAERDALDAAIRRKRGTQSEVLSAIGVAYARSILVSRKDALVAALAERRPTRERVELLISALLAASPKATAPLEPSSKSWRQVWPKLNLMQALMTSPQPPPAAFAVGDQLALAKDGDGAWSVFVR